MTEDYARTLKRRTLIALIATLISLVLLGCAMFWMWCSLFGPPEFMRKDNPSLAPQSAELQLDAGATVYWRETSYVVPDEADLGQLLHLGIPGPYDMNPLSAHNIDIFSVRLDDISLADTLLPDVGIRIFLA